jgi:hypothetical protein
VEVYWEKKERWFKGVVMETRGEGTSKSFLINYEDGETIWERLSDYTQKDSTQFRWVDESRGGGGSNRSERTERVERKRKAAAFPRPITAIDQIRAVPSNLLPAVPINPLGTGTGIAKTYANVTGVNVAAGVQQDQHTHNDVGASSSTASGSGIEEIDDDGDTHMNTSSSVNTYLISQTKPNEQII